MTHLPRDQAAATLGLCPTDFKKVCRRSGMLKWPYRRGWVPASDNTDETTNQHNDSPSPAPSACSAGASTACAVSSPTFAPTTSETFLAYPVPPHMSRGGERIPDDFSWMFLSECDAEATTYPGEAHLPGEAPPAAQSSSWEDTNFLPAVLDYLDALDTPPPPQIASGSASGGLAGPSASGAMGLSEGDVYAIVGSEPDRAGGGEGWRL